ncbi:methyltransferase [Colletotrichum tabaci]|uniref:Methyltransferase n=1 Tax=Colletotrichum tabaci TaxID=1209068 RepID=A0AAV9TLE8_9PEZI
MADSSPAPATNGTAAPVATSPPAASPPGVTGTSAPLGNPADEPEALEAADPATDTDDDGSSVDDRISSYTASITSSIADYPTEYGRRYHAFRPGSYLMPNDEDEMDRLDLTHAMMLKLLDNRLYQAPLDKDKIHKILDIGTGTGIWAMEMGDLFPNAEVYGNDLSPIQPDWVPPNVKFEIDDVESPWLEDRKYDFIFCRYMIGAIADWPNNLNPGGWAEFVDMSAEYYSDDGTLREEHATHKWNKTLLGGIVKMGREGRPGPFLQGWVRDAGFENMFHKRMKMPIGPWPKDRHHQELGWINLSQVLQGLEGFSMRVLTGVLDWTAEEVQVLLAQVRKELKNFHEFHSQFDVHVVYGQKPLEAETQETTETA